MQSPSGIRLVAILFGLALLQPLTLAGLRSRMKRLRTCTVICEDYVGHRHDCIEQANCSQMDEEAADACRDTCSHSASTCMDLCQSNYAALDAESCDDQCEELSDADRTTCRLTCLRTDFLAQFGSSLPDITR